MSEGTFSNGNVWAADPDANPIDDIKRCIEMINKKPARPSSLFVRVVPAALLPYKAPRLERERFSGGVNLSAQARNAARVAQARKEQELTAIVMHEEGVAFVSPRGREELRRRMLEAGAPPENVPVAVEFKPQPYALPSFSLDEPMHVVSRELRFPSSWGFFFGKSV